MLGFRQLGVLVWKNSFLVRRRHWFVTLLEIGLPLILFVLYANMSSPESSPDVIDIKKPKHFAPKSQKTFIFSAEITTVFFTPVNNFTEELVFRARNITGFRDLKGLDSEEDVIYQLKLASDKSILPFFKFVGLVFEGDAAKSVNGEVPKKLDYKIRVVDHFNTETIIDPRSKCPGEHSLSDQYFGNGYLGVQIVINKAFIELAKQQEQEPPSKIGDQQMLLQMMPCPPYSYGQISKSFSSHLPAVSIFGFMILCVTVTKRVVEEKRCGAKELMTLMGMSKWAFWLGWLIDAVLIKALTVVGVVLILTQSVDGTGIAVLNHTSSTLLFVTLMTYCVSAVVFLFSLSTFFSKPVFAMLGSMVFWFLPIVTKSDFVLKSGFYTKCLMMLCPNMALYFTFESIVQLEDLGVGAQWSNINGKGFPSDISLLNALVMYVVDIVLHSIITWYVSEVNPGPYGCKQPYFFFATRSYWLGGSERNRKIEDPEHLSRDFYERPLSKRGVDERVGIKIRHLKKSYPGKMGGPRVKAVRDVSLDICKGEITALLGHNGAGKTTTMSILTGLTSPTDGSVQILGFDLRHDLESIRRSLGLCPQHNLLFEDLTVHQHLVFFGMLKGKSKSEAGKDATELLRRVKIYAKKNALVSELSGGMKRKLQLAIALVGDPEVIVLDEPTSGLDPEARREIWDLLLSLREHKTILLCTHFMEEADVLGDTIAIMSHGNVECCGSPMYLKNLFGAGYRLNILKTKSCKETTLRNVIQQILPDATAEDSSQDVTDSSRSGPITFTLPTDRSEQFPVLLDTLERSKDELGISSFGISITTMEDVFLSVGARVAARKHEHWELDQTDNISPIISKSRFTKITGLALFVEQIKALLVKKIIFSKRHWVYLLIQIILPMLLTLATVSLSYGDLTVLSTQEPELPISLELYSSQSSQNVLYESDDSGQAKLFAKLYAESLQGLANVTNVEKLEDKLIEIGTKSLMDYRYKYTVAAEIATINETLMVNGFYSFSSPHSAPVLVDIITNTLLTLQNLPEYQISTVNHPILSPTQEKYVAYMGIIVSSMFAWSVLSHLGWIFASSINVMLPLQERVLGSRQLQMMAGCPAYMIWLSYYLVDLLVHFIEIIFVVVVIYLFDSDHIFTSGTELGVLLSILFLYGFSGTMFNYFVSFIKDSFASAFGFITMIAIFIGGTVNIAVLYLESIGSQYASYLRAVHGLILPHSALISSLSHFAKTASSNSRCKILPDSVLKAACNELNTPHIMCCENQCKKLDVCFKPASYFGGEQTALSYDGLIGQELIYFAIGTFVWGSIIFILDSGALGRVTEKLLDIIDRKFFFKSELDDLEDDEDVLEERQRAQDSFDKPLDGSRVLAVSSFQKRFGYPLLKGRFAAVREVDFTVERGECFGLLGVNGAGKSTTFKMLTGALPLTGGDALLSPFRLQQDRIKFFSGLGYCPQTDAQIGIFTGRETLQLYARLRGMPKDQINGVVDEWLEALGMSQLANRPAGTYSGGNRRKLSAAMALIGEPPVALLDEPTSGVDPISRRQLWQLLTMSQKAGQSIVLTSHSMDECEALCSRLGIMVAGRLVCLGPVGHLKQKFGQGYILMVKAKRDDFNDEAARIFHLKSAIETQLAPCKLIDEHAGLLHYHIEGTNRKWSAMFNEMESLKNLHYVMEDYTLSETTLEQLFLSFAK